MPSNETQSRYEAHDYIEDRRAEEGYGPGEQPILDAEVVHARRIAGAVALLADLIVAFEKPGIHISPTPRAEAIELITEGFRGTFDLPDSFIALVASMAARVASPVGEGV